MLRSGVYVGNNRIRGYFPHGYSYYPYYCPSYEPSVVYYSPFSYYYGVCPPYVYRRHCYYTAPVAVYIEIPFYVNRECRGYRDDRDDYYLDRRDDYADSSLRQAMRDIEDAFLFNDINRLADLTDPSIRIAIYRKGKYEYSVHANDYLDMTRDALRATDTVDFELYRTRRRTEGVYVLSGKHTYRNRDGDKRSVFVSFALERLFGKWVITQAGSAPDREDDNW